MYRCNQLDGNNIKKKETNMKIEVSLLKIVVFRILMILNNIKNGLSSLREKIKKILPKFDLK